jgi:hypothetical protein
MKMKGLILLTVLSLTIFKFTNGQELENNSDSIKKTQHLNQKEECQIIKTKLNTGDKENEKLVAILDSIYQEDQKYRNQLDEIEKEFDGESEEVKSLWKIIDEKDSLNQIKVKNILNENGWLGADVVGEKGNSTLFLVIQHSDLATQEKYLPMMRQAVKEGNAFGKDLAYLEDRVALAKGEKQIYGTQVERDKETGEYYAPYLIDPENVDKRRAEVGLFPLSVYFSIIKQLDE